MNTVTSERRPERWWGSALITAGLVLFAVVGLLAYAMIDDPGGYYDRWVPADDAAGPEASYEWSSSGLEVRFTDTSEAGDAEIERWAWDFGDGAVSNRAEPTHRFADAGEWEVTLDVVDLDGRASKAEGTVEVEPGAANSGDATIGLADMADKLVDSVDRSAKGGVIVVLVIGLFVVLALIGGRLVRYGVRLLRPGPDRIKMTLRPKELELAVADQVERPATAAAADESVPPVDDLVEADAARDVPVGV